MAKSIWGAAALALASAIALALSSVRAEETKQPVADTAKTQTQEMQKKISVSFADVPLKAVVRFFEELAKMKILIAPGANTEQKLNSSVTFGVHDMEVAVALKWFFSFCGMEYRIQNGVILADLAKPQSQRKAPAQKSENWESELKKKFQRKATFEFAGTPVAEAIGLLCGLGNVTIFILPEVNAPDRKEKSVTLKVKDITLESALEQIVKLADLDYDIRDQALAIEVKGKVAQPRHFSQISLPEEPNK